MEEEIWKPVVGYEWLYEVSNLGNVLSKKTNILRKITVKENWYLYIGLSNKWKIKYCHLHRIIAKAFIPNPENKPQINHKNWIKNDNRVENLEWCTWSENINHAYKLWLMYITENNYFIKNNPSVLGENNHNSKKIYQYDLKWNFIKQWGSLSNAGRELSISIWSISKASKWKRKSAWWFIWKYNYK